MSKTQQGCLGRILQLLGLAGGSSAPPADALPAVRINNRFITDAEADFFRVLQRVVNGRAHILAQVAVNQLLWFPGNSQSNAGRQTWKNKMAQKSIDFLLCDPATLKPLLAIELDEPTHTTPERQTRDEQIETMLRATGLPYIRVP